MTIKNPTPHEQEALRVADGLIIRASTLRALVNGRGLQDDLDLREALAIIDRTPEQIGESIRRVYASIETANTVREEA